MMSLAPRSVNNGSGGASVPTGLPTEVEVTGGADQLRRIREVPIHPRLRQDLTLWLEERPNWPGVDATPALFLNQRGGRLSARGASDVVAALADAAGQEDETTAHILRHTCGTHLVRPPDGRPGADLETEYDELKGIEWEWQAVDGAMTKAPFGGAATGANPTDRGKKGTKRSLRADGQGIPLAIVVAGANRHDKVLLEATLDAEIVPRPEPSEEARQHLATDRGYDYDTSREEAASRGYEVHIPLPPRSGRERA
jgi:hypothetical protein